MTSRPLDDGHEFYQGKKRRLHRACDVCRRKKIACDGILGVKCSTCADAGLDCTYVDTAKRPPPKSYLDLETRLEHADALVRQLRAELADVHAKLANSPSPNPSSNARGSDSTTPLAETADPTASYLDVPAAALCLLRSTLNNIATLPTIPHVDDVSDFDIASKFEKLQVGPLENAFIGKSSGTFLINAALDLKPDAHRKNGKEGNDGTNGTGTWTSRRLRYWTWKSPDNTMRRRSSFKFPPDALMSELFELYFTRQNILLPLLHRPTFERSVGGKLHLRNESFAGTVLLVCAIGSRWHANSNVADAGLDCGKEWFDQVELAGNSLCLLGHATLYDIQRYCLAAQFLKTSSLPQAYWTLVGVGLRLTQDLGLHRGKIGEMPSAERELQKRAFWVLVYLDRVASCDLGRTCVVQFSDFDIEPLLEVDDEYWEHPTHPFQQPARKPSCITFFNALIRLSHISAFSLYVLYSLNKIRDACSITDAWEEAAIAELDSSLNNWRDQIPDHLRWDPMREDPVFFDQSVTLWCSYYHLQISIHRPFIPMLGRKPVILPALTICTNAARACANLVDIQRRRNGSIPFPLNLTPVVISGLVLSLKMLSGKLSGLSDRSHEMENVHKCMEVIRLCESRWQTAGMYWDVLAELSSVAQPPPLTVVKSPGDRSDSSTADDAWSSFTTLPQTHGLPIHAAQYSASHSVPFASTSAAFPSEHTTADVCTDPTQASRELADMMASDALAMWTNVPQGFGVDDWGAYFSSFSDMTRD
ncbi:fungal-specific transcription factor domain-containing protein [Mycena sanguinolenta]|nr:fungal-specific transcription factor domain-containing protein [Mycena sanguinolenta]